MKLTTFLLLALVLQGSAHTTAQTVTYSGTQVPIVKVLGEFKAQTGYRFFYRNEDIKDAVPVTVAFRNTPLRLALEEVLNNQSLGFEIQGNTIFISRRAILRPAVPGLAVIEMSTATMLGDVRGYVRDEKGSPLSGITVYARSTRTVTMTGLEGEFMLRNINDGDTLQFSSINYETAIVRAVIRTPMTIFLRPKVAKLQAITIYNTGFQTLDKERTTGSFAKPDMQVFQQRTGTMDLIARLEGQVPGLQIMTSSNANRNGNGITTRASIIRGVTSPTLAGDPLYVLNGVVVADFSALNLDDVGDITVLKDAAAAAVWGARAANGVIVITTKTGERSQRPSFSYSGFVNYQGRPDFSYGRGMTSREFIQSAKEIFDPVNYPWASVNTGGIAPHEQILYDQSRGLISAAVANQKLDSLAGIDNMSQISDLFFRPVITTNHTISVGGGNNLYSFFASAGYTSSQSSTPGQRNNTYRLNLTQSLTAGSRLKLTISASLNNSISKNENSPSVTPSFLPYQLFRDAAGNNIGMNYLSGYSDSVRQNYQARSRINLDYIPLDERNLGHSSNNNISVNITANASVKIWKGLSFLGTYGYQKTPGSSIYYQDNKVFSQRRQIVSLTVAPTVNSTPVYNYPIGGGVYTDGANDQRNWTVRNQLSYDGSLRRGHDRITLQLGHDVQEGYTYRSTNTIVGYNEALGSYPLIDYARLRSGIPGTVTGFGSLFVQPFQIEKSYTRFISWVGLFSYSIDSKYFIDASVRQDYSNMFGKDLSTQNKPSWSFGARWQLTKEKFLQPVTWLNDLSFRATHGITGNSPGPGRVSNNDVFSAVSTSNYANAIAGDALTPGSVANRGLSWEITHVTNLGLDFSLFNRRISGGVEVYQKNSTDLLGSVQLNPLTGRTSITGNIGKLVNKGIEFSLRGDIIRTKDFSWNSSFNIAYNNNKLVSYSALNPFFLNASSRVSGTPNLAGYNINSLFAYQYAGLDNMGDPQIYLSNKTVSKNPSIAQLADVVYVGTTRAPYIGGFSNTFSYKGLSLSANIVYSMGGKMRRDVNQLYSGRMQASQSFGSGNYQNYFLDRWRKPGDEAFTDIPSYEPNQSLNFTRRNLSYYTMGDVNVISSSLIRLRDVTLNYSLPSGATKFLRVNRVSVFVQATNFLLWTANKDGIDPDQGRYVGVGRQAHGYSGGISLSF